MMHPKRPRFSGKTVLIIGASGGLGAAFARAFAAEGATLLFAARRPERITTLAEELGAATYTVDVQQAESLQTLAEAISKEHPDLSIVVNATGVDVRKPLEAHSLADVDQSLSINLRACILITQTFLPIVQPRGDATIVHMGAFADGRLAFPYYSVDVATRAGLRTFIDAVNRENAGSGVIVSYFSPCPADTEAERPFHPLWKQMQIRIAPAAEVADALLASIAQRRRVTVMGGVLTRQFARLNAVFPALADGLMMNRYRGQVAAFLGVTPVPAPRAPSSGLRSLAFGLIVLSFVLYGIGLLMVPFLPIETGAKAALIPTLLGLGEVSFWVGAAIVGKALVAKYRRYLNPLNWCSR